MDLSHMILVTLASVVVALLGILCGIGFAALAMRPGGRLVWNPPAAEQAMGTRSQERSDEEEARYLAELDEVMSALAMQAQMDGRTPTPVELRQEARHLLDEAYERRGF
jgi:hypothetical protein